METATNETRNDQARRLKVGDMVAKRGGDYYFFGQVRSIFTKKSGIERVVVENSDGILHIFNPGQLYEVK